MSKNMRYRWDLPTARGLTLNDLRNHTGEHFWAFKSIYTPKAYTVIFDIQIIKVYQKTIEVYARKCGLDNQLYDVEVIKAWKKIRGLRYDDQIGWEYFDKIIKKENLILPSK